MAISLYGSPISTFARKVAIGLELKGLAYELVDALTPDRREELRKLNPRVEVPVLKDGDLVVVNSSDILQYLDWRYPEKPLYPASIDDRVVARAFERLGDQRFNSIVVDCSSWHWAERDEQPPPGLLSAAQLDLAEVFAFGSGSYASNSQLVACLAHSARLDGSGLAVSARPTRQRIQAGAGSVRWGSCHIEAHQQRFMGRNTIAPASRRT